MAESTSSQDAPVADRGDPGGSGSAGSWMVRVTLLWMAGLLAGAVTGWAALWLIVTAVIVVVTVIMYVRRGPATAMRWAMVGVVSAGAAWFVVRQHHVRADHIGQYATARP